MSALLRRLDLIVAEQSMFFDTKRERDKAMRPPPQAQIKKLVLLPESNYCQVNIADMFIKRDEFFFKLLIAYCKTKKRSIATKEIVKLLAKFSINISCKVRFAENFIYKMVKRGRIIRVTKGFYKLNSQYK